MQIDKFILSNIEEILALCNAESHKMSFRHILSPLVLWIRSFFTYNFPQVKFIFEATNLTKWKVLEPFINELGFQQSFAVIPHSELERTAKLKKYFMENRIKFISLNKRIVDYRFFILLIRLIISKKFNLIVFVNIKSLYSKMCLYKKMMKQSGAQQFFSSNDDDLYSPLVTKFIKQLGIKTVNVTHGRAYLNNHEYDISILQSNSQKSFLRMHTNSKSEFIIFNNYNFEKQMSNGSAQMNLVFFDQIPDVVFPYSIWERGVRDLSLLASKLGINVFVKLHPAANQARKYVYEEYNLKIIDHNVTFGELEKKTSLGLSICSSSGFDLLQVGIPILYLNYNNIMDKYAHIDLFKNYAVENYIELERQIILLSDLNNRKIYYARQVAEASLVCKTETSLAKLINRIK